MQGACGFPITVYGTGGQMRAFIHVQDTVRCIQLAVENPPQRGDRVRILNQMTEIHRLRDLAGIVARLTGVEVQHLANPRQEAEENELQAENVGLRALGLSPTLLSQGLLEEVVDIARKNVHRCDRSKVLPTSFWNRARVSASKG
jgi:UDP-sulfoquinovose synthase